MTEPVPDARFSVRKTSGDARRRQNRSSPAERHGRHFILSIDMSTRAQNELRFRTWEDLQRGGRRYRLDVQGRQGWSARYLKEVDGNETTVRFWQEIYDDRNTLVEIHEK